MKHELDRYLGQIRRRLRVDRATRTRILSDLASDWHEREQRGQTPEQILAEMGPAKEVAESFNQAFLPQGQPARPAWRWAFLAIGILPLLAGAGLAVGQRVVEYMQDVQYIRDALGAAPGTVGVIGGADGPTAIFVASAPAPWGLPLLPVVLGCLAVFCALQWPGRWGWRRWLPAALAALGLLAWIAGGGDWAEIGLLRYMGASWGIIVQSLLPGLARSFFAQGGFVPLGVLAWLAARRRHAGERKE